MSTMYTTDAKYCIRTYLHKSGPYYGGSDTCVRIIGAVAWFAALLQANPLPLRGKKQRKSSPPRIPGASRSGRGVPPGGGLQVVGGPLKIPPLDLVPPLDLRVGGVLLVATAHAAEGLRLRVVRLTRGPLDLVPPLDLRVGGFLLVAPAHAAEGLRLWVVRLTRGPHPEVGGAGAILRRAVVLRGRMTESGN
eukprot:9179783-Pyramimonas_sp.AAC.1